MAIIAIYIQEKKQQQKQKQQQKHTKKLSDLVEKSFLLL